MKKIILIVLTIIICSVSEVVFASNGDVVGHIYSTDIKACINGVWVDSYNIGGKTAVILEDITDSCTYSDNLRMLVCYGLRPESLSSAKNLNTVTPGYVVGDIYETDIKTYFYGKEIPCYALNGKMAVAIEDLGGNGVFSDIGGRFFWNPDERTITLESAYDNSVSDILNEKHLNMEIDYDISTINFVSSPIIYGGISGFGEIEENEVNFTYKDETVCRTFQYDKILFSDNIDMYSEKERIYYYDIDKIAELVSDIEPIQPEYTDWLDYYKNNTLSTIKDRFETNEYIFLYMFLSHSHGGAQVLIKLDKRDGTRISYDDEFQSVSLHGQKYFENVVIDKENEKIYLHYDADYVIDLKTDTVELIRK